MSLFKRESDNFKGKKSSIRVSSYESYREYLEKIITEKDSYLAINPAIYEFILYNPITGINRKDARLNRKFLLQNISKENLSQFLELENTIIQIYETHVFSKMSTYLNAILNTHFNFNIRVTNPESGNLKRLSKGALRNIINEHLSFSCNEKFAYEFKLNYPDIVKELQNDHKDSITKDVFFFYSKEEKIIFMFRKKTTESTKNKFDILFDKLDSNIQENFVELATYVLAYSKSLFERNNYQELYNLTCNKGGKNYFLPKQDIYAVRIARLDQNRSIQDLRAADGLKEKQLGIYYIHHHLKDDHRKRVFDNRPGGIHHTYTDISYLNYGFEFQFLDFKSLIFTYFGETKDSFKKLRK